MKAVGLSRFGGPEVLGVIEVPEPHAGPGQVRMRVHAATVNPGDRFIRSGWVDLGAVQPPYILGMEAAGIVDEIGEGTVTDLRIGDRAMAVVVPTEPAGGAYREYLVLSPERVVPAPANSSHAEAATLPMNGLTARLSVDLLGLTSGQTVAVTGAAGAVGGYVVQMAKAEGLTVVADASEADTELVRSLGADVVVRRGGDIGGRILSVVRDGVDGLVDTVGIGAAAAAAVRDGGAVSSVTGAVAPADLRRRGIRSHGAVFLTYADDRTRLDRLRVQAERGELTLRVARTLPADQAADAHRLVEGGGIRGRVILEF